MDFDCNLKSRPSAVSPEDQCECPIKTTSKMLEEQEQSELNLTGFLRVYANSLA